MVNIKKQKNKINKLNFTPLGSRVLIKPFKIEVKEEVTESGIYIKKSENDPDKDGQGKGKVVAVGSDSIDIKNGDMVIFTKFGPLEIKIKDEDYLIAKQEDILAIYY